MDNRAHIESSPITRVKCVVDNCEFWDTGNHCIASVIEVQPPHASDTDDTDCATFKPRHGVHMNAEHGITNASNEPYEFDSSTVIVD